jgi:hypothetical protein
MQTIYLFLFYRFGIRLYQQIRGGKNKRKVLLLIGSCYNLSMSNTKRNLRINDYAPDFDVTRDTRARCEDS